MAIEPITRKEKIIAGENLEPITRMEQFLKKFRMSVMLVAFQKLRSKYFNILQKNKAVFTAIFRAGAVAHCI